MPLTLVLGPANSAKAGEVLSAYAAEARRAALLVVPTALDADYYARELALAGSPMGSVLTFGGLAREIARRVGFGSGRLSELQRLRAVERAVGAAGLELLSDAAGSPGFVVAVGELVAELERTLVTPARFSSALQAWAGPDARRMAYGRDLAALYFAYRRELERSGKLDSELYAWQALDALRAAPGRWGGDSVFFYGFDDLHALQRDAVETLCRAAGTEVTVSLTFEPGRAALAARAEVVQELSQLADRVVQMPALDEHYAAGAREALHHLERHLFEGVAERVPAGDAVVLLEAGGERAESELIAAEVLALLGEGVAPEEVAVVLRSPERGAAGLARVLERYGVPCLQDRPLALAHTAFGAGLMALARCALFDPRRTPVSELLAYLRVAGEAAQVDELEARIARAGVRYVAQAGVLVPAVPAGMPVAQWLAGQARELLAGLGAGGAPVLEAGAEHDARAGAAALRAIEEVAELEPGIGAAELIGALERVRIPASRGGLIPGAVLVTDPLSIRARRFRAVIVAGLQEGEFPRPGSPDPFLSDELRGELAAASGLRLRLREDSLARERYLLYACVSRASERLVLSFRSSDEEGNLALPSPFLHDIADLLDEGWWERRRRRLLADVVWPADEAPTARERRLALAAAEGAVDPPGARRLSPVALAHVRHREVVSAGALEKYADCPVSWLVERQLNPEPLEITPEALARGSFMHDALERVLRELGDAVTERTLPRALEILEREVGELPRSIAPAASPGLRAAALRMIQADLRRYLEHEARTGCDWRPMALEQRFGFDPEDSLGALELGMAADGLPVRVRGAIDRIDVAPDGRRAVVRDYKSGSVRQESAGTRWAGERKLQVALYMLAVRELLGLEPVAGLYQPLRGGELRPRGAYLREVMAGNSLFAGDGCEAQELEAMLEDARARALALATRLRSGELEPCPATCSRDGCRHPGICRVT